MFIYRWNFFPPNFLSLFLLGPYHISMCTLLVTIITAKLTILCYDQKPTPLQRNGMAAIPKKIKPKLSTPFPFHLGSRSELRNESAKMNFNQIAKIKQGPLMATPPSPRIRCITYNHGAPHWRSGTILILGLWLKIISVLLCIFHLPSLSLIPR